MILRPLLSPSPIAPCAAIEPHTQTSPPCATATVKPLPAESLDGHAGRRAEAGHRDGVEMYDEPAAELEDRAGGGEEQAVLVAGGDLLERPEVVRGLDLGRHGLVAALALPRPSRPQLPAPKARARAAGHREVVQAAGGDRRDGRLGG